ncbi:DUF1579 domain-containing protein [Botrimarina hoheduenensis]|nr:DUF1579 domain-containing protein [Botrimarina hoheduenensis]
MATAFSAAPATLAQSPPQPTQEHRELAKEAGVWDARMKIYVAPEVPPLESEATETCTMLGPFWLVSVFEGSMAGTPFTGHGQTTFDPRAGEWVSTWIDSLAPTLMTSRGTYDPATRTATYQGDTVDWMTGQPKQVKMTLTYTDDDHKEFRMHERPAAGAADWAKMLEISYTRR